MSLFTENEVYALQLAGGREVVARVTRVDDETIDLSSPMQIHVVPTGMSDKVGVAMTPLMIFGEKNATVTVAVRHVVAFTKASDHAKNEYLRETSGIAVARPGDIGGILQS